MGVRDQVMLVKDALIDYPKVEVIAATKYMDIEQTEALVDAGIYNFGENRTDMFLEKYEVLKDDKRIKWHFFGVLQTRKIREVVNKISCLHSLDKLSLAIELDKKLTSPLDCFVQVNISGEEKKSGLPINKVKTFIKQLEPYKNIRVVGLMCIASMSFDEEVIKEEFKKMQKIKDEVEAMKIDYAPCHHLSMGMSNDYKLAVQYGATHVRLGRVFLV